MSKEPKITVATLCDLAQHLFRCYTFEASTPTVECLNGYIIVKWKPENATGQAAFSQTEVVCKMELYHSAVGTTAGKGTTVHMDPWQLFNLEMEYPEDVADFGKGGLLKSTIRLSVNYKHHDLGSNGISRSYFVQKAIVKENQYILVAEKR